MRDPGIASSGFTTAAARHHGRSSFSSPSAARRDALQPHGVQGLGPEPVGFWARTHCARGAAHGQLGLLTRHCVRLLLLLLLLPQLLLLLLLQQLLPLLLLVLLPILLLLLLVRPLLLLLLLVLLPAGLLPLLLLLLLPEREELVHGAVRCRCGLPAEAGSHKHPSTPAPEGASANNAFQVKSGA